jgi:hypothetical protein
MRVRLLRIGLVLAAVLAGAWLLACIAGLGVFGRHEGPGEITAVPRASDPARNGIGISAPSASGDAARQILFGDLHVHTSVSFDAFAITMPLLGGEGARPAADACDFARFCSALDFFSYNDHAESITSRVWQETAEAARQCNAVGGDPEDPDLVAFLGWEWTQSGPVPERHFGHRNVIVPETAPDRIPARPVASRSGVLTAAENLPGPFVRGALALLGGARRYHDAALYLTERANPTECQPEREPLAEDCRALAETPAELFAWLDRLGQQALVIPHGTTWGWYTPPGSTWDRQLESHDPSRQRLFEIYSGHGNSEVYRDFRAVDFDENGRAICPAPSKAFLPTCWQAGTIVERRCLAEGIEASSCEARAREARANAAAAGQFVLATVPGTEAGDWLDAGQCRGCAQPAFNYRPGGSAQYVLSLGSSSGEDSQHPRRFRFGFIASSDNHFARAGTGYKEIGRIGMTESGRGRDPDSWLGSLGREEPSSESRAIDPEDPGMSPLRAFEWERQASFFQTGGLVAVHAEGRSRGAIWDALKRREVYGTSGPRILLWFDLLNPPAPAGGSLPMGSEASMREAPRFRVAAVGSMEQLSGCPEEAKAALGENRLQRLCLGECYHPSGERRLIDRIEVVRIRPAERAGEPLAGRIQDPWRTFSCSPDPSGCSFAFEDPEFISSERDAVYYVRAVEKPAPAINAAGLRCRYDDAGRCIEVRPCGRFEEQEDDCLATHEPRAWSSPIFIDQVRNRS